MAFAISPHFQDIDFPSGMSLDQKIEVFADRIDGWQLGIAKQCVDTIPHSGFAVLSIVCSYFEMIAKFKDGFTGEEKSKYYFEKGFGEFLSHFPNITLNSRDELTKRMWRGVRCALYHAGITGPNIELSGDFNCSVAFASPPDKVQINPHKLVPDLQDYFQSYIRELRNQKNEDLRRKFETRFDYRPKSI